MANGIEISSRKGNIIKKIESIASASLSNNVYTKVNEVFEYCKLIVLRRYTTYTSSQAYIFAAGSPAPADYIGNVNTNDIIFTRDNLVLKLDESSTSYDNETGAMRYLSSVIIDNGRNIEIAEMQIAAKIILVLRNYFTTKTLQAAEDVYSDSTENKKL